MSEDANPTTLDKKDQSGLPVFTFRRMSGLDQAILTNDEEWQNLEKLDPQVWMALSCPVAGLEFNKETLDLLDTDNDGRIRAQDVKDAVAWVCQRVIHPSELCKQAAEVDRNNLRVDTEEGKTCAHALELVLKKSDKPDKDFATIEEISGVLSEASSYAFNGDGIITIDSAIEDKSDPYMPEYLHTALQIIGGKLDATGKPGIDETLAAELEKRVNETLEWRKSINFSKLPLGEKTGLALSLYNKLAPKFDDYFARCHLAAFDPDALARLNADENAVPEGAVIKFSHETLLSLPISRISTTSILDLSSGLNPAWEADIKAFVELAAPLVQSGSLSDSMDENTWKQIRAPFIEYAALLDKKPKYPLPPADAEVVEFPAYPAMALAPADDSLGRRFLPLSPNETIGGLDDAQLEKLISPEAQKSLKQLIEKDLAAPPLSAFQDLHKLALFHAWLYTFLMNFVSFVDFYDPDKKAIFQEGVLYLDSRACYLCVPVDDVDNHARLAEQSHLCLIYCACTRKTADGADLTGKIAAALTIGNLASLIEGRHGLFIDNAGEEWDTQILRVVHNPISLREAMWAPYIRASNMIAEQVNKFVASKDKAIAEKIDNLAANPPAAPAQKPADQKPGFDFAKGAGIFAAVSVAISVLSAAFAYIANSVASLGWWWPVAIIIVFICISGPSMLIAYFKLRKRSLGPLLDASGWAVNKGAPINIIMGMALTKLGKIPGNAVRNLNDPYSLPERIKGGHFWLKFWIYLIILAIICIFLFWLYCQYVYEPLWVTKFRAFLGI